MRFMTQITIASTLASLVTWAILPNAPAHTPAAPPRSSLSVLECEQRLAPLEQTESSQTMQILKQQCAALQAGDALADTVQNLP